MSVQSEVVAHLHVFPEFIKPVAFLCNLLQLPSYISLNDVLVK